jgi:hypothetical protein
MTGRERPSDQTRRPISFAGIPPKIAPEGTSSRTTAPAAITAPSPIRAPGRITQRLPIQTSDPIYTPTLFVLQDWRIIEVPASIR